MELWQIEIEATAGDAAALYDAVEKFVAAQGLAELAIDVAHPLAGVAQVLQHVLQAVDAAAEARHEWARWPWEERAAVFLKAAELLGTTCVLTGIRPAVAQTLVEIGVDLTSLKTLRNLQEGLKE